MPSQKSRRLKHIPDKLFDLITLPDSNDYTTYRDNELYPQFGGEVYLSDKWPDKLFGLDPNDVIKICVYGNNGGLIATEFMTHNEFESFINTSMTGEPAIVRLDPGAILRSLGYRRGRFTLKFEFMRLKAGGPFPILVNGKEKIYFGQFNEAEDGYLYAQTEHPESETIEGDQLYVKENKFIIQEISSDRTELIVSPGFINDENYIESFRLAAYNCLNWFPDEGMTATFANPTNNIINFPPEFNVPRNWINGTIRINDAYFMGKTIIPEERDEFVVDPDIDIDTLRPNLLKDKNLDSLYGYISHGAWPNVDVLTQQDLVLKRALFLESVAEANPVGQLAVKATVKSAINLSQGFLESINRTSPGAQAGMVKVNYSFYTGPAARIDSDIEGVTMTMSVWVKAPENSYVQLMAHSGAWGLTGNTAYGEYTKATGQWQRIHNTFTLTNTKENSFQFRCIWSPQTTALAGQDSIVGTEILWAGAMLQLGSEVNPFTRIQNQSESTVEITTAGTIKYADPEGTLMEATFPEGNAGFTPNMAGGILTIEDGLAIDDMSTALSYTDSEIETIFEPILIPKEGSEGKPGGAVADWDQELHSRAITVTAPDGSEGWTNGYNSQSPTSKYSHAGTSQSGYHAQWTLDKGLDGEPCMFFPDLNYLPYILDRMKEDALEAWNSDESYYNVNDLEDPRLSNDYINKSWWPHRWMGIRSNDSTIATLAGYGVKPGDTIRVSWYQKSAPVNFDQGLRKGANVGLYHYYRDVVSPPPAPTVSIEEVEANDGLIFNAVKSPGQASWNAATDYFDPLLVLDNEFVNAKPTAPPESFQTMPASEYPDPKPSLLDTEVGQKSTGKGTWIVEETFKGEMQWTIDSGADTEGFEYDSVKNMWSVKSGYLDDGAGEFVSGVVIVQGQPQNVKEFGWEWNGSQWISLYEQQTNYTDYTGAFRQKKQTDDGVVLLPAVNYPSREQIVNSKTISEDETFIWAGTDWVLNNAGEIEQDADGEFAIEKRTFALQDLGNTNGEGSARRYIACEEFNEWEYASFEFVVGDKFNLEKPVNLYVYGHYGDFGPLYVDKVKVDLIMTSDIRVRVDDSAVLAPLELEIEEIVDSNTLVVTQKYDIAAESQGNILSNFKVNKFSTFDKGFSIDYKVQDEQEQNVFARYEGKILDVINTEGSTQAIVDKTYTQFGEEINAITSGPDVVNPATPFESWFTRYRINDPDNLYTYLVTGDDSKSLIINFKPVQSDEYPGALAYKLLDPLPEDITELDQVYIAEEVTPDLREKVDLIPFLDEAIPETVLRLPKFQDLDSPIRERQTEYLSHTDIVGNGKAVREKLENRLISGSLEKATINVDYAQFKHFSHFGSVEQRVKNMKTKLVNLEVFQQRSASLTGNYTATGYLENSPGTSVSAAQAEIQKWEDSIRDVVNGFDDFENYMYFQSSSYITSSLGLFYDNAIPKKSGDGTLTSPYENYAVTESQFTTWYDGIIENARTYDRANPNMLINLLPEHISYDVENEDFLRFMHMIGHHYDQIWTHIKALTDVHDRSEDITKGISQALVEPVAKSLGFEMKEGKDLVSLPQYYLGLAESGSNTGIYNVRFTKKSQKDVTREIWNRILASMPYMLKSKGTKQGLKSVLAAYGIPTSILRIQEYGGPKIGGEPDYEIKPRFTKALDFKAAQYVESPWYHSNGQAPNTIETRFKTAIEKNQILANKVDDAGKTTAGIYLTNNSGSGDAKGLLTFVLSGSAGLEQSMSIKELPIYNGQYWSTMVRRRNANSSSISSSYEDQVFAHDESTMTQSFDMFLGYYDSGIDRVITKASASMTVTGSLLKSWYETGSAAGDHTWFIGGKADDNRRGFQYSGSLMEWRYWSTPLTASAFFNHVAAPKAVNGNHESSSYFDMSLRFSMDDNINLSAGESPNGIKDYSLTDGQTYATASGFADEINFSNVQDRQKAFVPRIGMAKKSNKIRLESNVLKTPDGLPTNLSPTERVEVSSYDLASNDSNKLGIFFAPTDVINEDIILSMADLDFGKYLGDPRDEFADRYEYGKLDGIADTYWKKWTTKQGFWDYLKLIKYYDLSLFDHLRRLSPARAKKNLGILIEPTLLERTKVSMGKNPSMEDLKKTAIYDFTEFYPSTSSAEYRRYAGIEDILENYSISGSDALQRSGSLDAISTQISGSQITRTARYYWDANEVTSSNLLLRQGSTSGNATSASSQRFDYIGSGSGIIASNLFSFESFKNHDDPLELDYQGDYSGSFILTGGGDNIFFESFPPNVSGSRLSRFNQETIPFYSSSLSASVNMPYSHSLQPSEFESVYDNHTALFNLAYAGCKENGNTVPFGEQKAVEIFETNPYQVKTDKAGGKYLDTELKGE